MAAKDQKTRNIAIGATAATAGLAVGLATNLVRKAIVQAPTAAAGNWDEALATEHRMTLGLFDLIQKTTDSETAKRATLLMQLKHALGKHAFEEENAVYAAMRDAGQIEDADHLNHDHGYVKQYLYDLTIMPKGDAGWLPKVAEFRKSIEKHMREEEDEIFPTLKRKLAANQNKALTVAMNKEGLKVA